MMWQACALPATLCVVPLKGMSYRGHHTVSLGQHCVQCARRSEKLERCGCKGGSDGGERPVMGLFHLQLDMYTCTA